MAYSDQIGEMPTLAKNSAGVGYGIYRNAAEANSKIEQNIGLSLAKNSALTNIAKTINEKAQIPTFSQSSHPMDLTDKFQIEGQKDSFGGARASAEGWDTLGRSVYEAMHTIEKNKPLYSTVPSYNTANPYFIPNQEKPAFDQPINQYKWGQLPKQIQRYLSGTDNFSGKALIKLYDDLSSEKRSEVLLNYRYENASIDMETVSFINISQSLPGEIIYAVQRLIAHPENNLFRAIAKDLIIAKMNIPEGEGANEIGEQQKAQLAALLDIVVDKHTSGDHTNIVSRNGDGRVKDQWIEDTVAAGKPIISGPSGHTLRYLNFWAKKRNENKENISSQPNEWPSLEAARLVMMADLLPPRHHSYDEVMTASIGIKDEASDALKYEHKSSYEDLTQNNHKDATAGNIAQTAYNDSGAYLIATSGEVEDSIKDKIAARKNIETMRNEVQTIIQTAAIEKIEAALNVLRTP